MKIAITSSKDNFTEEQQKQLAEVGEVVYIDPPTEYDFEYYKKRVAGAEVLAADPDNLGGFEKVRENLTELMETLPDLRGLTFNATSFGWIDLNYCKKRGITACNVPGYSKESVAELTLTLLLGLSLKVFLADRRTQKGNFVLEGGYELKGKSLGVIGLGSIGSRTAELGCAIGMRVIAYNRSSKSQDGVVMKSFDEVLKNSDYIAIHVTHTDENKNLITKEQLSKMKDGVMIVNTADREAINEEDLTVALKSGQVGGYAYEGEDFERTPLAAVENAFGFRPIA